MKRKFTFLTAALALLTCLAIPLGMRGQTYTKATSITAGDIVVLVAEDASMELSGITTASTRYGLGTAYTATPAGLYELTVVEGTASGTFAFKHDNAYLTWTSGNSLATATTASGNTSWNVTFDANGNAAITNSTTSGTNTRQIWWNVSSPRFACYTGKTAGTSYYSTQLYKKNTSTDDPSFTQATCDDLAYDATSGTISYTLNAQGTTGTVSASVPSGSWITLTNPNSFTGDFTCSANPNAVSRNETVTLYYTVTGDTEPSATTTVTVTQAYNPTGNGCEDDPFTVAEAIAATPASGTSEYIYVSGIVSSIVEAYSSQYHNISYNISADGETTGAQLEAFRGKGMNNADFTSDQDILPGDEVTIYGQLQLYGTTYELASGNYLVAFNRPGTYHNVTLNVNPDGAGAVTVNGSATSPVEVAEGATVNISATSVVGYIFNSWTVSGAGSSVDDPTSADASFTMGTVDATLTANFTAVNTYTVTYHANVTGTTDIVRTYNEGVNVEIEANTFVYAGHAFTKWNTTANGSGTEYNPGDVITSIAANYDLYAQWDEVNELNDCLDNAFIGVAYSSQASYSAWVGKTGSSGAVYAGQSAGGDNNSGSACIQLRSNNSNSGIVTTASGGKALKVTVTWNGATGDRVLQVYGKNTAYSAATDLYDSETQGTLLGEIAKSNNETELIINGDYEFIGLRSKSGAMYLDEICITWFTNNTPAPTYTLTFQAMTGGTMTVTENSTELTSPATVTPGATLDIVAIPTITSSLVYRFDHWEVTGEGSSVADASSATTTFTMGTENATLEAWFTQVQTYTVTFNPGDGGTFNGNTDFPNPSNTVPAGTYTLPSATKAGYTFNGWAMGATTLAGGASYEVTGNADFVASYTQNTSGAGGTDCLDNASTGVSGSTYTSWTTTGTSDAAYAGQSAGGDATSGACIQLRSNNNNSGIVTTTSGGKAKKVTVTWNENKTDVRTLNIYGSNTAYTSPTELYGSNPVGELIGTIVNGTSTELSITDDYAYIGIRSASGAIFLDAVCIEWEGATPLPTHTITLNQATGGVISADKQEAAEGETVTLTATPNVGYTFGGWTVTPASTTLIPNANTTPATFTMSTLNVIVTATFTPTTAYTVSFDINGKVEMTATVNSGEAINLNKFVADVTTDGYTFDGWYTAATGGTKVEGEYQPGEDVTLYAKFTETSASDVYTLVTSEDDLHEGYLVVIASSAAEKAMSTNQKANNRGAFDITKENNTISWTPGSEYTVCEFTLGGNSSGWSFHDGVNNGYIYAAGTSNSGTNYLRTESPLDENNYGLWTISIDGTSHKAAIVSVGNANTPYLRYNTSSDGMFACYHTASQSDIVLYTKPASNSKGTRVDVAAKSKVTGIANNVLVTVKNNGIVYLTGANEGNSNNLVVEDGGQLVASNNVAGTMLKHVTGFGDDNTPSNYYLISAPFTTNVDPFGLQHMVSSSYYDLYYFDQNPPQETGDYGLEWRNYKSRPFDLEPGIGYLYANKETCNVEFADNLRASYDANNDQYATYEQDIENRGEQTFAGWNLVGNPFTSNASVNKAFFKMNASKNGIHAVIVPINGVIAPMEGVFVKTENDTDVVTFTATTAPVTALSNSKRSISLNVNRDNELLDRAIVNVNAEGSLCKLCLSDNVTKIYFAQNAKEYALVSTGAQGEMPVSFKAAENGTYTISVDAENMEMNYLHLIDNMTGADVDLLATPSYTFEARTNDYTSRFRLVFSASNSTSENETETFAYYNGSEWVISNMGEATLQVIDVMGRVLSSETVNGFVNVSLNQTPGVYMLRLINGNSVRVQKIVVK